MTTATTISTKQREPTLLGQTVVLIGGRGGIGLETARRARAERAEVILTGRDPERLEHAAQELGVLSRASFDAADPDHLARFFRTCRLRSTTNTAITGATYDIDGGQQLV